MTVLADDEGLWGGGVEGRGSSRPRVDPLQLPSQAKKGGGGDGTGQLSSTKIIIGIDCDGEYKLTIIPGDKFWAYVELIIFYSDLHCPFLKHRPAILLLILIAY